MIDWDDVRFFLAVARNGSVRAAAESLEVNHSTVLRRIAQLEGRLGAQMFEKLPSGYRVTDAGEEALDFAEQMEASSNQLTTRVLGRDQSARGLLRVTMAPTFRFRFLRMIGLGSTPFKATSPAVVRHGAIPCEIATQFAPIAAWAPTFGCSRRRARRIGE
ncbi:regulatory helix-turn-helix LysR family protein [Rhizobium sullae]|uniref:Regulatory helix-turn-helix LysR family protein n=1 Tax=Rhizobium sullae TaxID=50338 RepID=A0A4R3PT66_RHISU|nr:regulatory helix-turn-helix LysR family protein [Rhizobium sullae]